MSIDLMSRVWKYGPTDPTDQYVLLAIADNANDEGEAFPSIELMARKTRYSTRTVMRTIQSLEAGGWLRAERRTARAGRGTTYFMILGRLQPPPRVIVSSTANLSRDKEAVDEVTEGHLSHAIYDNPPAPPNRSNHQLTISEPLHAAAQPAASAERHTLFRQAFDSYFKHKAGVPAPWDGKEAKHLGNWLKANPTVTLAQWQNILRHRARSPVNHALALSAWIAKALTWLEKPQDEWGREVRHAAVPQSKTAGNLAVLAESLAGEQRENRAGSHGELPAGGARPGNAGIVLLGPGERGPALTASRTG